MPIRHLHPWNVSVAEAQRIQEELRARLDLTDTIRLQDNHFMPEPTRLAHNLVTRHAHPERQA